MKVTIVEGSFGILAFDAENKLIATVLFLKNPQSAAKTLANIEAGRIIEGVSSLIGALKEKGYDDFAFENANLAKEVQEKLGIKVEVSKPSNAGELLRSKPETFAVKAGFVKDADEFALWTHNVTMEITKLRVKGAVEKRDLVVAQAIQSLDELDKTINMLMARVREWYGIHFPELDRLLEKHETYARLVVKLGNKDNFTIDRLEGEEVPKSKAEGIAKVAEKSMGADLDDADLKQIQVLCSDIMNLYKTRQNLETYMDSTMEEVAPNMKYLVGSLLGARLIALSGGLMNLAKRPASTVQVLGAEKALFRSLKTGTRPPKHGLIFQHTLLHDAKRWQRGKIARALAGKLAIAARADAFGGRHIGKELKANMDKRIEEIHQKYDQPPPLPVTRPRREKPRDKKKWGKHRRDR
ncbi:MAG: C/D box methylation guide ribonucleoprotein complex aNOP56 subunit [Candidatus Bathyarchaeia archaeon]|jgi:nucleolar protein 56